MGTRPVATKGLVMGVPFPELESDDAGVDLNRGGLSTNTLCVKELDMHYVLRNSIHLRTY